MASNVPIEVLQGNDEEVEFTFTAGPPGRRVPYVIPDDATLEFSLRKSQESPDCIAVLSGEVINSSKGKCRVHIPARLTQAPGSLRYRMDIVRAGSRKTGAYGELRILAI